MTYDEQNHEPETSSDDTSLQDQPQKSTPLPGFQLFITFLIQFAEPITATVILPFVPQFVRSTGITKGDEKKTGYYAGIIVRDLALSISGSLNAITQRRNLHSSYQSV